MRRNTEATGFDFQNICWVARMCQISEMFYLGLASFVGLGQIFSFFHGNFITVMGIFEGGGTCGELQLALPVCSSPCARLLGFGRAEEPLWGTMGEWKTHFFSSEHGATNVGIWPLQQHSRTHSEGGGKDPGKEGESRSGTLQPTESLECISCQWPRLTQSSHLKWSWGWSLCQLQKPNLLSKHHPFLASSDAGNQALVCFLDLNIRHFGWHKYSQSCLRALLYSLLFCLTLLYAWRRAWTASMRSPCISWRCVPGRMEVMGGWHIKADRHRHFGLALLLLICCS